MVCNDFEKSKMDDLGKIDGDAMKCFRTTSVLRKWVSCLSLLPMIAPFCPKSKHWHVSDSCNLVQLVYLL